jgi:protoheme ferro-lyase
VKVHHVVLVTYGEPRKRGFIGQLVYSWRILVGLTRTVASIPKLLLPIIAVSRGAGRRKLWTDERYESPLEPITERQAQAMRDLLARRDSSVDWRVHVAYEFRRPLLAECLASIPHDEPVDIIPLYAADSAFTHALSRRVVADFAHARSADARIRVAHALDPQVLGLISAAYIRAVTSTRPGWRGQNVALVLAAHGTLLAPSKPIDTGREATEAIANAIRAELGSEFGVVLNGWLNHTRGGKWTEPAMADALKHIASGDYTRIVYFPYGFLADNAETQLEGRIALREHPAIESWHLPCLNESPELVSALADGIVYFQPHAAGDLLRVTG